MWLDIRVGGEGRERDGVAVLNHYPKVSQHFHTLALTIAKVMIRLHIQSITLDSNWFDIFYGH